jgi:hypothetical protein
MSDLKIKRLSTAAEFERCLAGSADRPVFLLKHSTT